jgi:hypothetical protein
MTPEAARVLVDKLPKHALDDLLELSKSWEGWWSTRFSALDELLKVGAVEPTGVYRTEGDLTILEYDVSMIGERLACAISECASEREADRG